MPSGYPVGQVEKDIADRLRISALRSVGLSEDEARAVVAGKKALKVVDV